MRTMLLSFKPHVYQKILNGQKIFEHRRTFPDESIMAYMYVSKPVCTITGIIYLGKRHRLKEWLDNFKDDLDAVCRIKEYLETVNYAMEISCFQETSEIPLSELRENVDRFVVPQMYYYLDGKPLLNYLQKNLVLKNTIIDHNFDEISSAQVCRH